MAWSSCLAVLMKQFLLSYFFELWLGWEGYKYLHCFQTVSSKDLNVTQIRRHLRKHHFMTNQTPNVKKSVSHVAFQNTAPYSHMFPEGLHPNSLPNINEINWYLTIYVIINPSLLILSTSLRSLAWYISSLYHFGVYSVACPVWVVQLMGLIEIDVLTYRCSDPDKKNYNLSWATNHRQAFVAIVSLNGRWLVIQDFFCLNQCII